MLRVFSFFIYKINSYKDLHLSNFVIITFFRIENWESIINSMVLNICFHCSK